VGNKETVEIASQKEVEETVLGSSGAKRHLLEHYDEE
jgi:hypothetical protein